jgi:hypothetical protein
VEDLRGTDPQLRQSEGRRRCAFGIRPTLGRPLVDFAKASSIANLKELRPRQTTIRVLFVFGPWRSAILLSAGDEASQWKVWYERAIRKPGNCTRSN